MAFRKGKPAARAELRFHSGSGNLSLRANLVPQESQKN